MIKVIYTGNKHPDFSTEEFKKYYLENHAPLFIKTCLNMRKYTINFPIRNLTNDPVPGDFITEIWFDDMAGMQAFYKSDAYKQIIEPDELKLFSNGKALYVEECVQQD